MKPVRFLSGFHSAVCLLSVFLLAGTATQARAAGPLTAAVATSTDPVKPGEVLTYTITATNTGTTALTNVVSNFLVPANTKNYSYYSEAPGTKLTDYFNTILPGQSGTVTHSVQVNATSIATGVTAPPDGTLIHIDVVVSNSTASTTTANDVVVEASPAFGVQIGAEESGAFVPGAVVSYAVRFGNTSTTAAGAGVLRVPVPAGTSFISASDGGAPGADGVVQWNLGAVGAGASGQRRLTVQISAPAGSLVPADASIIDAANAASSARGTTVNAVTPASPLELSIAATPDAAQPGQVINYTFTATNTGTTPLTNVKAYHRVPIDATNYSYYSEPTGTLLTEYFNTIPPGQSKVVTHAVKVNAASASTGATAPRDGRIIHLDAVGGADNNFTTFATHNVTVKAAPAFSAQISAEDASAFVPGAVVSYAVRFGNTGAANGVLLRVPVPAGTSFISASDGGAPGADGVVQWNLGAVGAGVSGLRRLTVQIGAGTANGSMVSAGVEVRDAAGFQLAQGSTANTARTAAPLILSITASPDAVKPGQVVNYSFTAANTGTAQLTNVKAYYRVPVSATNNSYYQEASGTELTLYFNTIPPGQSGTQTGSISINTASATTGATAPPDGKIVHLEARAESDGSFSAPANCDVTVDAAPAFSLTLAANDLSAAEPGATVLYTIHYGNTGNVPDNAVLRVPVPTGTSFAGASNGGAPGADGVVQWNLGAVGAGARGEDTLALTINPTAIAGSIVAAQAEIRDGTGASLAHATSSNVVRTAKALTLAVTAAADTAAPGGTINYTFTATNTSTTALSNVKAFFRVPSNTVNNSYYKEGAGTVITEYFNNIPPQQSRTLAASVNVNAASVSTGAAAPPDGTVVHLEVSAGSDENLSADAESDVFVLDVTPVPVITSVLTAGATVGQAFSYQIVASNGATSYTASGLPVGVSLNASTGLISGTPTAAGVYSVALGAVNGGGAGIATLTLTVSAAATAAPVISSASTVGATVGQAFSFQIVATNGPTNFSASGLPSGLSVDGNRGLISGTPTAAGVYTVAVNASNGGGTGTGTLVITVAAASKEAPVVTVADAGNGQAVEAGAAGKVTFRRTGDTSAALTVRYKIAGAAKAGVDYKALPGTVTIPAGASLVKIKIKPLDNHKRDGTRVAKVKLLPPSVAGSYTVGSAAVAKIKVVDND